MEEIQHFSHEEHPLMFVEEFENDDEEIQVIVCSGCDQSIYAPAYKCFHCNFFLHKSCAELPPNIQHPVHPSHPLVIRKPSEYIMCDACSRDCERCFFYHCSSCDFDIDIECAYNWRSDTDDGHQHESGEILRKMEEIQHFSHEEHPLIFVEDLQNDGENEIVCSGCAKWVCGPAYKCSHCNFFLHKSCAGLPTHIHHPLHPNHTLFIRAPASNVCDACHKSCERCFFYGCNRCDFEIDVECASGWLTKPDDGHQHEFFPILHQIHYTCQVCGEDRNSVAQVCRICQLLAHYECTLEPRRIRIMADRHLLTLYYSLGRVIKKHDDHVFCNLCYKKLNLKYAGYYCQQCDFVAHLKCAYKNSIGVSSDTIDDSSIEEEEGIDFEEGEELEELKHFHHEHNLFLSRNQVEVHHEHKLCEGCVQSISAPFYSCQQCNYFLHSKCARLPLKKQHPKHLHLLTLSARGRGNYVDGLILCDACDRLSHGFGYMCHVCPYSIDIRCSSIPKTFRHEGHQHPLFHAVSSDEKCNACDMPNYNFSGVFVCTECNFALGFECATLPLKVKYEYDPHSLSLTCTAQNDSEEYYCLICEEERNSNHWFYCCVECNFTAHSQCVVGSFPYIKYRRTFDRKWHQHPLTFIRRTKDISRPCDACGESFEKNVGLNCTQCKSFIHFNRACMFG